MICEYIPLLFFAIHNIRLIFFVKVIICLFFFYIPGLSKRGLGFRQTLPYFLNFFLKFLEWHTFKQWYANTSLNKYLFNIYFTQLPVKYIIFSWMNVAYVWFHFTFYLISHFSYIMTFLFIVTLNNDAILIWIQFNSSEWFWETKG